MFLKIGLAVVAIVAVFLVYVAMKPADYMISRELAINATPEKIFPYLNGSKLANNWMPWKEVDPQAEMAFEGPEFGPGAKTSWDSKGQLGKGSATILESVPNQRVRIRLAYVRPFEMEQEAEYVVRPAGEQNIVTWSVRGKNNFIGRAMCAFMNMDKMVGGNFERGLANLKALVEKSN